MLLAPPAEFRKLNFPLNFFGVLASVVVDFLAVSARKFYIYRVFFLSHMGSNELKTVNEYMVAQKRKKEKSPEGLNEKIFRFQSERYAAL
jgi:hypothetical protein